MAQQPEPTPTNRIYQWLLDYECNLGYTNLDYQQISRIRLNTPGKLYLSGSEGLQKIQEGTLKVDVVISVCCERLPFYPDKASQHSFQVTDTESEEYVCLPEIASLLHKTLSEDKRVLIHCIAGMSRSATAVLYYMVKYYLQRQDNETNEDILLRAIKVLKNDRQCIFPNKGFIKLLLNS